MDELSPITAARFWSKVDVLPSDSACWLWKGAKGANGYGHIKIKGIHFGAHQISRILVTGEWPGKGQVTRHKCDTPLCVNPHHLELGTKADNYRDMIERGNPVRHKDQSGENNGAAKPSSLQVAEIKKRIANGEQNKVIAQDYPVDHAMISRIKLGRSWA